MSFQTVTASVIAFGSVSEAAAPAQDTWVLRCDDYDYYVKAGCNKFIYNR